MSLAKRSVELLKQAVAISDKLESEISDSRMRSMTFERVHRYNCDAREALYSACVELGMSRSEILSTEYNSVHAPEQSTDELGETPA